MSKGKKIAVGVTIAGAVAALAAVIGVRARA